ncbi:MAG: hypothetical protein AB7Y46_02525 [Armatimonadota bacterium]
MDLRTEAGRRELGRRIQAAVAEAGYDSLPAFATRLGCSRALIYQYVNGDVLVQLDRLSQIAELVDRPLDWFLAPDPNGCAGEMRRLQERLEASHAECERLEHALAAERGARLAEGEEGRRALLGALAELCRAQRRAGDAHGLVQTAARCADLARALGDEAALVAAHLQAGHGAWHLGQREAAEEALEEALARAQAVGDRRAELSARQELVRVWQASGRVEAAREQARALAASESWWPRWAGTVALAALAEQAGELAEADEYLTRAEEIIAEPDAPAQQVGMARAFVQSNRCNLALARGWYVQAAEEGLRLHDLAAEAGLPDQVREATLDRAIAQMRGGHLEEAGELLARLRAWGRMSGDRRVEALAACFEAERLARARRAGDARRLALEAMDLASEGLNGQALAEAEFASGLAHLADGRPDDAAWHLQRCAARAERLGLRRLAVAARVFGARARIALGDGEGPRLAESALAEAEALGYEDLCVEAALALDASGCGDAAARRAARIGYAPVPWDETPEEPARGEETRGS